VFELSEQMITPRGKVRSLVWRGDDLIDFASGGIVYRLDGAHSDPGHRYGDRLDAAVISPSGRYALLHERLGTKGLLLDGSGAVRAIERSDYHANAYEYPAVFASLHDGREMLFHCPHEYNRIEALDAATAVAEVREHSGQVREDSRDADFFHSRLTVSPGGRWLASAGWVWHPIDRLMIFKTAQLLRSSRDDRDRTPVAQIWRERLSDTDDGLPEVDSVAFLNEDELIVSLHMEGHDHASGKFGSHPTAIEIWNLAEDRLVSSARLAELSGPLLPLDREWVIGFHGHPKLINLLTGRVERSWSHIETSTRLGSICLNQPAEPILALDLKKRRFALCDGESILVATLRVREG
jgi:hypothetical protein